MPATATRTLADFGSRLVFEDLPTEVVEKAKLHILDALGIAFPASKLRTTQRIVAVLEDLGGKPESTVLLHGFKTSSSIASISNGTLFEALDYDDLHEEARLHPTAVILPAVLAVGESNGSNGRSVITAYVAGTEVMCRLGAAASEKFHERGFQATSVCGTIGAAVAAGNLLGLNRRQLTDAMGIAANLAFGSCLSVRLSSYCSNIDTGRAAESGVLAALLARNGVSAKVDDVLEGNFGFLIAHVGKGNYDGTRLTEGLKETWEISKVFLKRYPMGYDFTRYIDAVFAMKAQHTLAASNIAEITYGDNATAVRRFSEPPERKRKPLTRLEASTSRYYAIAAAIMEDKITSEVFSPSKMGRPTMSPTMSRLMNHTHYVLDERDHWVEVALKNGEKYRVVQDELVPTTRERVVQKFYDNALSVVNLKRAKQVQSLVDGLDLVDDVGELCGSMALGVAPLDH